MNHCEAMSDALNDAALGQRPSDSLRGHLAQCSACTAELERRRAIARRMDAAVIAMAGAQPAARLTDAIAARTRGVTRTRPMTRAWPGIALGAALAATIAGVIIGLRAVPPPATHNQELVALSAWHSPTAALMVSNGSVLAAPLRDVWFDPEPGRSHTQPMPGVSHAL